MDARFGRAFGVSLAVTSVLSALLVVAKERSAPLMAWMAAASGHHWITHGVLTLATFVVLGFVFARFIAPRPGQPPAAGLAGIVAVGVIAGGLIIAGFFLLG